jgi:hypothetical protein
MCIPGIDPVTIGLALATSAAGAAINGYEQNKTQNSMISAKNAATMAELQRQKQFQADANAIFDSTKGGFEPEAQAKTLQTGQDTSTQAFAGNTPTAEQVGSISTANAPKVVQDASANSTANVFKRAADRNTAAGNLQGYTQNFLDNNISLNRGGQKLGTVSDLARTSSAVGGLEQNAAYRNAFKPNSGIGDLFTAAGQIGSYGAGRGWFTPTGAPAAAPGANFGAGAQPFNLFGGVGGYT